MTEYIITKTNNNTYKVQAHHIGQPFFCSCGKAYFFDTLEEALDFAPDAKVRA